jgi:hypothetical protein
MCRLDKVKMTKQAAFFNDDLILKYIKKYIQIRMVDHAKASQFADGQESATFQR